MIDSNEFYGKLVDLGVKFATGVPDSTFKGLISLFATGDKIEHMVASSECDAMAIGAGRYLATSEPSLVYMQNSGFGKIVNPHTSLSSKDVYSIPTLLMVGWRGEPGVKDEPQHKLMGRILPGMLDVMEIPYKIIEEENWESQLEDAVQQSIERKEPYALVVKMGLFSNTVIKTDKEEAKDLLSREDIIELIVDNLPEDTVYFSTTGKTSRELFEIREKNGQSHNTDFYTVGSMGCASSLALGASTGNLQKVIATIDGDGAALMQMGSLAASGHYAKGNFKHIVIDNNSYESTGGQPTISSEINFKQIADACGYEWIGSATTKEDIVAAAAELANNDKCSFLLIKSKTGSRKNLGRPTTTPIENKTAFMDNLK